MFRSKLWLCLFHALQLSCLIGISSPLAKFKYKQRGIIKKVMVVFEIIIRVTSIYKGFLRLWKLRVCVVHFIDQMPSKFGRWLIWSIYIHGQLYDHQTDLSAVKYQANKMINSIFFFQNETSSRSASGANLKIMSLQGGGGGVTPPGYSRVWVKRIGKMVDIKRARMMKVFFVFVTNEFS